MAHVFNHTGNPDPFLQLLSNMHSPFISPHLFTSLGVKYFDLMNQQMGYSLYLYTWEVEQSEGFAESIFS